MNDLEYTILKICERRGVTLSKVESLRINLSLVFGLAVPHTILPAVANVFYYAEVLNFTHSGGTGTAVFYLNNNSLQGSAGNIGFLYRMDNAPVQLLALELDTFVFNNSHTAGAVYVSGPVFKITYT